jgi:hypothetical protein
MQHAIAGPTGKLMQSDGAVHAMGCTTSGVASTVEVASPSLTLPASPGFVALLDWQAATSKTASVVMGPILDMHEP